MNELFDYCVEFLHWLKPYFGMSYQEINIWIFIIIEPIIFFVMCWYIIKLRRINKNLLLNIRVFESRLQLTQYVPINKDK